MSRFRKLPRTKLYIKTSVLIKALLKLPFNRLERTQYSHNIDCEIAHALGFKYGISVSTCRMAFHLALKSFHLQEGDEILMTPITIPDMVNAVHLLNLKPIFVDIDPKTHFINIEDLKNKITDRSKVLLLTYLSGFVPDLIPVLETAKRYSLYVVEDISQNYKSFLGNKPIGTFGDATIGTFSIGKTLASLGGGAYFTNNEQSYHEVYRICKSTFKRPSKSFIFSQFIFNLIVNAASNDIMFSCFTFQILRLLSLFNPEILDGIQQLFRSDAVNAPLYDNPCILRNRMPVEAFYWFSDLQSEVLETTLEDLNEMDEKRIAAAEYFFLYLDDNKKKRMPVLLAKGNRDVFWHLPYMTKDKTKLQMYLLKHGVDSTSFQLRNCAHEKAFEKYKQYCPGAEKVIKQTVLLPIHSCFTSNDMLHLAKTLNNFNEISD